MNTWLVTVRVATAWLFDGLKIATGSAEPRKIWLELSGEPLRSRSEEHTSELQSPCNLVCRLLLEKKKQNVGLPLTAVAEQWHTERGQARLSAPVHSSLSLGGSPAIVSRLRCVQRGAYPSLYVNSA